MVWVFGVVDFEVAKNRCRIKSLMKSYKAQRREIWTEICQRDSLTFSNVQLKNEQRKEEGRNK